MSVLADASDDRSDTDATACSGIRTILVPPDIVGVRPREPARIRRSTPCRPDIDGQAPTVRCGQRDWFSDHLFVESQDGHARTGYGASITVHVALVAALVAFLLAQPDVITIHMPSLPMPAMIASMPLPPMETVNVQSAAAAEAQNDGGYARASAAGEEPTRRTIRYRRPSKRRPASRRKPAPRAASRAAPLVAFPEV